MMLYTDKEQLTVLQLKNGEGSVCMKKLNALLSERPSNMIYCENNGKLVGIISTGDILRAYREGQDKVRVNRRFTSLHDGEYMKAKNFFFKNNRINALPVVSENGTLEGDYTRWDDLLILEYLIETDIKQCIEKCRKGKEVMLVRPCGVSSDRQRVFKKLEKMMWLSGVEVRSIEHSDVSRYMEDDNIILFVEQNEIRACITRLKILFGKQYREHNNLKIYRDIFSRELNFSDNDCAVYLKELQDKGIKIFGLIFEESTYYKKLLERVENRFTAAGEKVSNILPKAMYEDFLDNLYSKEYAEGIFNMPIDYENNGGVCSLKDCKSRYYNVLNGERCTTNQPKEYTGSVYFFGPCYIYGHYAEDKNTIESLLQNHICHNGGKVRVVNCGCLETRRFYGYLPRIIATQLRKGDIVVIDLPPKDIEGVYYLDLNKELEKHNVKVEWMVDKPWHCNHKINQIYAEAIYDTLIPVLRKSMEEQGEVIEKDENFIKFLYLERYFGNFDASKYNRIGSIVMNCNPFTYGHRYLVEQALNLVDFLIIFVVEQDKSVFSFAERFAMVKKGVEELDNVMVVPSGPFILSQMTVPEYFNNKQMTENVSEHEEQDVAIFAGKIAPPLGIKYRFVGEEPFDEVTNRYNMAMKKVLPQYGIDIIIIPRKESNGKVISATAVRKCLKEKNFNSLKELLPDTTRKILGLI